MKDDTQELTQLAEQLVQAALKRGATVAEVSARSGWELSTKVRLGEPELVEEAGHRGVSMKVIRDQRVALSATSDLSAEGLERLVADAIALLDLSQPDDAEGPADPALLARPPYLDLDLYDPAVEQIDAAAAIERATQAERVALAYDKRLTLSEGATFARTTGARALVLSNGFVGTTRGSYASLVVSPVAKDEGGKNRRGFYWTARRHLEDLEDTDFVGEEAARRTLRRLGPRKVETCEAPVIFDADAARSIIGTFAGCITGGAIWRKSSYLTERRGTAVASPLVNLIDDPLLPRAPGSRAFDGEGMPSRRSQVVKGGQLETFLLDWYSARKLGLESTASASRSGASVGASTSNFILEAGELSREELIKQTGRGLYVTEMMGFGFNPITGDFSRGAAGYWIENGELAFPVSEITISSDLDSMLKGIDLIASDLELKSSIASPTFRVASMTISGT